jgi:phosphoglucomutase
MIWIYNCLLLLRTKQDIMQTVIQANIDKWMQGNYDQSVKDEILNQQKENPDELADAFYKKNE